MNLNEFAKEVHALAVEKGFYETEPSDAELIAAIHSEISEAFEEWRAGKPMVWHRCNLNDEMCNEDYPCYSDGVCSTHWIDPEPHGIAVELIDVVLRALDMATVKDIRIVDPVEIGSETGIDYNQQFIETRTLPELVVKLHSDTALLCAGGSGSSYTHAEITPWADDFAPVIIYTILTWLRAQNLDPEHLLTEKHNYNKTRPYRHGGKRV